MKFDSTDIKIFNAFVDNEYLTSTDIAKMIFTPKNRDEMIAKNTLISYRLKKWLKSGLIINNTVSGTKHYSLNDELITIGESFLTVDGKQIEMGNALIIDIKNNGYIIKFLDEE